MVIHHSQCIVSFEEGPRRCLTWVLLYIGYLWCMIIFKAKWESSIWRLGLFLWCVPSQKGLGPFSSESILSLQYYSFSSKISEFDLIKFVGRIWFCKATIESKYGSLCAVEKKSWLELLGLQIKYPCNVQFPMAFLDVCNYGVTRSPLDFVLRALWALRPCDPRVGDWIVC